MTNQSMQTLFAGDSSDVWEFGLVTSAEGAPVVLAQLDGNFSCRLVVVGAQPPIIRAVTDKNAANTRFLAWLTPVETMALGKGTWQVGLELRNLALQPPLVREKHEVLRIEPGLVPPP